MSGSSVIHVHTFGELSLEYENRILNFSFEHPYKLWLLILYFVYHRNEDIYAKDLVEFIWRDTEKSRNPLNALKALLFRLRNKLEEVAPGCGHDWIVFSDGCYHWAPGFETQCDYDAFDRYLEAASQAGSDTEKKDLLFEAAHLYEGEFAQRLSYDPWVAGITSRYRKHYLRIIETLPPLLEQAQQYEDIIRFCMDSLEYDPYNETLGVYLMRALGVSNRQLEAINIYESLATRLLKDVGVIPSEELRAAYRSALSKVSSSYVPFDELYTDLTERPESNGAVICDYDFFRTVSRLEARHLVRSGGVCHLAMFFVGSKTAGILPPRSLNTAFHNLREILRTGLRAGDVVSVCSNCQYVVLLPDANYDSSISVCMRIARKFAQQYPHSPATIRFEVHAIEPYHAVTETVPEHK